MSAAKHTPGPWSLETVRTSCGIVHKIGPFPWKQGRTNHACVYVDYPSASGALEAELLANAHLMKAAPELLEGIDHPVLRALLGAIEDSGTAEASRLWDLCLEWFEVRDALIAKALGSTP